MNYKKQQRDRRSIRLKNHDYTQAGLYFLTICSHRNHCIFGTVQAGKMRLNTLGNRASDCWQQIPTHFPHVQLHESVVMPNHIHGILEITYQPNKERHDVRENNHSLMPKGTSKTIGSVVRGFKTGVTQWAWEHWPDRFPNKAPIWHRNYYEHIIRNDQAFDNITNYIIQNPIKWQQDKFHR